MKANMFRNMGAAVVLLGGVGTAGAVSAATCEDFKIKFNNVTNDELKVKKFEYEDDYGSGNWKTETGMFGADGFQKIEHGHWIQFTRDLGGIGGETTQFKVTYQHRSGGTVWGDDMVEYTGSFPCRDKELKTVTLDR